MEVTGANALALISTGAKIIHTLGTLIHLGPFAAKNSVTIPMNVVW